MAETGVCCLGQMSLRSATFVSQANATLAKVTQARSAKTLMPLRPTFRRLNFWRQGCEGMSLSPIFFEAKINYNQNSSSN